jgi:GcrA cell cycle regulator
MIWTDERIEKLKTLHAEGLSASKIAARLGGVSRNAVIGKVVRLGLGPLQGNHQVKSKVAIVRAPRVRKAKPDPVKISELQEFMDRAPPPVVETIPKPKSLELTLMELERNSCRWPEGERATTTFCGHDDRGWQVVLLRIMLASSSRFRGTESERKAASASERAA